MKPIARTTDPVTSHEAAQALTDSGRRQTQREIVLALVKANPGRTSAELARIGGVDRYMVARRLPDLEPEHVRKGAATECTVMRRRAVTWWLQESQGELAL